MWETRAHNGLYQPILGRRLDQDAIQPCSAPFGGQEGFPELRGMNASSLHDPIDCKCYGDRKISMSTGIICRAIDGINDPKWALKMEIVSIGPFFRQYPMTRKFAAYCG